MGGIEFLKGHGTQNDFVLLPDAAGRLDPTEARVAALCDPHRGLGADGVLRVVRAAALDIPSAGEWFMDYRNADGSIAEMCGNGTRVFARYLVETGLVGESDFSVATRGGVRKIRIEDNGDVTVDMGKPVVRGHSVTTVAGHEYEGVHV